MRIKALEGADATDWGVALSPTVTRDVDGKGRTLLMRAAAAGQADAAVRIGAAAAAQAYVNAVDSDGWTAVTHAAHHGHWVAVWVLVRKCGADAARAGAPSTELANAITAALAKGDKNEAAATTMVAAARAAAAAAAAASSGTSAGAAGSEPTTEDDGSPVVTIRLSRDSSGSAGFSIFKSDLEITAVGPAAAAKGVREGMRITRVNNQRVYQWADYTRMAYGVQSFTITVTTDVEE